MNKGKVQFKSTTENAEAHLARFVETMQQLAAYPGVAWNDIVWDVTMSARTMRGHQASKLTLVFAEHASKRSRQGGVSLSMRIPLLQPFDDLAKACTVRRYADRNMGPGPQKVFLRAVRYVYGALPLPVRRDPTRITRGHFVAAEAAALEREKPSSAYRVSVCLNEFAGMLDRHALCRAAINFRASVPRTGDPTERTTADFSERTEKLPSKSALEALANLSNDPRIAAEPLKLLRMRIVELLVVCGFRIGEALSLPANALVREPLLDQSGVRKCDANTGEPLERLGLRYWPEKGGEPMVKWVPAIANPFVLRAVRDINRICKAARKNALWLEHHPSQVNLAVGDDDKFTHAAAAKLLGLSGRQAFPSWLASGNRGASLLCKEDSCVYITGANLKFAIAQDRWDRAMLTRANGRRQMLSESLIVTFLNAGNRAKAMNRFISVPLNVQQISDLLASRGGLRSIFEELDITDDSGKPFRLTTHAFRRLLNTIAQRGGLTQAEIALWMGRRRVEDNAAYDLRTSAEMAADMRTLVEKNEVYGTISDQVGALPETERQAFLNERLTMIHITHLGQCASNIAENPCATAVSCLGGCAHYLRRKGDAGSRAALKRIEHESVQALERANGAAGTKNAPNWVRGHETVLKNVRAALAIDDDPEIAHGEICHVNPGGPVLGKPL